MTTGFLGADGQCFATSALANDHYFTSQPVVATYNGQANFSVIIRYEKYGADWLIHSTRCAQTTGGPLNCSNGTTAIGSLRTPPPCDYEADATVANLNILIAAILGLMLATWAARQIINLFRVPHAE